MAADYADLNRSPDRRAAALRGALTRRLECSYRLPDRAGNNVDAPLISLPSFLGTTCAFRGGALLVDGVAMPARRVRL